MTQTNHIDNLREALKNASAVYKDLGVMEEKIKTLKNMARDLCNSLQNRINQEVGKAVRAPSENLKALHDTATRGPGIDDTPDVER